MLSDWVLTYTGSCARDGESQDETDPKLSVWSCMLIQDAQIGDLGSPLTQREVPSGGDG